MDKLTEDLKKKLPGASDGTIKVLHDIIRKGATYACAEPKGFEWKSKKLETNCPDCGSHRICIVLKKGIPRKSYAFYNVLEDSP